MSFSLIRTSNGNATLWADTENLIGAPKVVSLKAVSGFADGRIRTVPIRPARADLQVELVVREGYLFRNSGRSLIPGDQSQQVLFDYLYDQLRRGAPTREAQFDPEDGQEAVFPYDGIAREYTLKAPGVNRRNPGSLMRGYRFQFEIQVLGAPNDEG